MLIILVYDQINKKYTRVVNSLGMTTSTELVLLDEKSYKLKVTVIFIIHKSITLTRIQ